MPQLWKIPILLLTWASYDITTTPPTPPAHAEDRAKYTRLSRLAMLLQTHDIGRIALHNPYVSPLFMFGVSSAIIGALIRRWSYHAMGRHFTFQLAILKDHQLVTHGPYAYVRHPGYTAIILNIGGLFACELSGGSWWVETHAFDSIVGKGVALLSMVSIVHIVAIVTRAPAEDRMLHEKFGKEWEEWKVQVPYLLFPGIL
ncbi:hypothetical protein PENSPDRAFT_674536 [Peniophora sp. CONT]|nr:hypothetical protein PENSPDRAFT_674536 [Peniophora sp. CONT]